MKPRTKTEQLPIKRIPLHELFPQPDMGKGVQSKPKKAAMQGSRKQAPREAKVRSKRLRVNPTLWAALFLGLILSGFGVLAFLNKKDLQAPYVLVEVRALEESGHPVTAADVTINDQKMGVTDSFGEWRRYLQLHPGDELKVQLDKKGQLSGKKLIEVPLAKSGKQDIEVQVAINLTKTGVVAPETKDSTKKSKTIDETPKEAMRVAEILEEKDAKLTTNDKELEKSGLASDDLTNAGDTSLGIYFDDGLGRINITSAVEPGKALNVMDKHQSSVVKDRVLPILVNDLLGLGLTVDKSAPWKLALSYVSNGEQVGYIRADIEWQSPFGQKERSSFLAGFAKTYDETARGLSSLLRLHMKKTYWAAKENGSWFIDESHDTKDFWRLKPETVVIDTAGERFSLALAAEARGAKRFKLKLGKSQPCEAVRQRSRCMVSTESLKEAPPLPGWVLKKAKILGPVPSSSDVYVAGFQAHSLGNGQWEFWSKSGSNLKALIVANGKIIHSESFKDNPGESLLLKVASTVSRVKSQ